MWRHEKVKELPDIYLKDYRETFEKFSLFENLGAKASFY